MPDFCSRLIEERKRLGLNQAAFGALGGVTKDSQLNYEKGTRRPDSEYLEALAMHDVDVAYVLTGHRMLMAGYVAPPVVRVQKQGLTASRQSSQPLQAEEAERQLDAEPATVMREVTREEAALLDNYNAADEKGRAAARSVLDALAEPKKRANG
ncbi:helix-turn-helix domain-containing protein [uncultured Pseudacidovorax sp.]|uniref:helix-turn-helix domain-containing protein n=1 Tax=uncultured Pseudacidovorax sp. TaxID=679313 RepID=UPI0025F1E0D8|nr:helix-turn-helix domain-containing protein [uncultured Pseudacidovorax sp.]